MSRSTISSPGAAVAGHPSRPTPGGAAAAAARSLRMASEFAASTQGLDGAWRVFTEPRILENAVVACSLTGVEGAQAARARAARWLAGAQVQRHDRFAEAADGWLVAVATTGAGAAFVDLDVSDGPRARRALYLHALACAAGCEGADARRLLDQVGQALAAEYGQRLKPWQRTMLLAFQAIARSVLGLPVPAAGIEALGRAQGPDGSFYGMPLVTGMLHLALNRVAPGHRATLRARENLLAGQHPDGTWRFMVSETWDTGLMVRALRGHHHFDQAALPDALAFLAQDQNGDGGWGCAAALDSDNDTTGNTLLALAGTPWADQVRAAASGYARRHQTPEGLWTTWLSHDDTPAPDVVAHMVAGIDFAVLSGIDTAPARRWLADHGRSGYWPSDWYVPAAYGAAEISTTAHPHPPHLATVGTLLAQQRPDGGWPRIDGEPYSSPAATGLALTALTAHRRYLPESAPAVDKAVRFLINAQTDDGTWRDRPLMYGPRPFLTATRPQIHALAARGLRDTLTADQYRGPRP
ncbi:prenyltransferase/squalene oxidase repeat-containing protein [Streptomyces sp. BE133]|uniref:prenyltransferase/squalene oxidase repeat-containing protein n=1 Tax=Streptomyces sp. BE133 TaxID=3002523 RepID=UPI002E75F990|nr:prenyltransferase/squalene oxidase repeat-containing protein [Streptomyces sp. BE133]MEE1811805.1 terpene cyclase/mutase family protein [Streptomyces sp. BE133]